MDSIDRKIVASLMKDGRISFRDLGNRIHLSPNATAERVRRLQSIGVIRRFRADVDLALLGFSFEAYIDVKLRPGTTAKKFEAVIAEQPGVVNAAILTGNFDFRVRVACKAQADLVRIIEALRERAGVQETTSSVIVREIELARLPDTSSDQGS